MTRIRRAALALVPDAATQEWARRLTVDLDERFGTGYAAGALPPHVSLKQPFEVRDLAALEAYAARVAAELRPVRVILDRLRVWALPDRPGVGYLTVEDGGELAPLHDRLNHELPEALGHPCPADFDGDYVPHLTVAYRGGPPSAYDSIADSFAAVRFGRAAVLERLDLFVYREEQGAWEYLQLTGTPLG